MKRFVIGIIAIILSAVSVHSQNTLGNASPKKQVVVYLTDNDIDNQFNRIVESKIITTLNNSAAYRVLERNERFIAAIERDRDYVQSGRVRDSQIADYGKEAGAQYVLVVDMWEHFNEFFIAMRMVNVESDEISSSAEDIIYDPNSARLMEAARNITSRVIRQTEESNML